MGLCRKWTHSGKVPSNLWLCALSGPTALLPDEINYQFPQSDYSCNSHEERMKGLMSVRRMTAPRTVSLISYVCINKIIILSLDNLYFGS